MRIKDIIAHLFDHHIVKKQNWTVERLAAWVKTVEPKGAPHARNSVPSARFSPIETAESQAEIREWQLVTAAFTARHESRRKRDRHRP
jgi:hypothetical protein